jgi:hypothetical protein
MALSRFKTSTVKNKLQRNNSFWNSEDQSSHVTNGLTLYVDGESTSSLLENLVTYSEQIDNSAWFKESSVGVSANATTDPIGGGTADKVYELTNNGAHRFYQGTSTSTNTLYTYSLYAKASERNIIRVYIQDVSGNQRGIYFNLTTGQRVFLGGDPVEYTIQSVGNGWYRISVTTFSGGSGTIYGITNICNNSGAQSYAGDGSSGVFLWGLQVARGKAPGTYVQTTASAVTKNNPTTWYDISGNNNHFSLIGSPSFSTDASGSISFNQSAQYGVSSSNAIGTSSSAAFTLEAFALTTTALSWQTVLGTQTGYKQIGFLSRGFNAGVNGGAGGLVPTGAGIFENGWYHLAMTTSGNSLANFYLNGVLVKQNISIGTNGNSNGVQTLSTYTSTSGAEMLNGRIGLARCYNRQLSDSEILKNFNANRGRFAI